MIYTSDLKFWPFSLLLSLEQCATPVCLPSAPAVPGDACWAGGHGNEDYNDDNSIPDTFKSAGMNIFSEEYSRAHVKKAVLNEVDFTWMLIAGIPDSDGDGNADGGTDSCSGDSGSGLVCRDGDKLIMHGINSWGSNCGKEGKPGVWANVWQFKTWIQSVIDGEDPVTPKECVCSQNTVLDLVSNTNTGTAFTIMGECDEAAKKKKPEDWTVFCDADGNGEQNGDEQSISFTMDKKCKKISSGTRSINCGDGDDGGEVVDCQCSAKPKDCPTCDAECLAVDGKNVQVKFTCPDGSENAGAFQTLTGKCKKFSKAKVGLDCDGDSGGIDCTCQSQANAAAEKVGAKAVCINANKKKPTYRFFCDDNENGEHDDGESSRTDKDKCKKLSAGNLDC